MIRHVFGGDEMSDAFRAEIADGGNVFEDVDRMGVSVLYEENGLRRQITELFS